MSDLIPLHIQEEIMKRLPVKSLIQFRSVSKAWKSLIDSSAFIAAHTLRRHTQPIHLLVSCYDTQGGRNYVSYIDDETFPNQRSRLTFPPPLSTNQFAHPSVVGSTRGLLCFEGRDPTFKTREILLWNPSIRKSIIIDLPARQDGLAFGVCPVTNDPKILAITISSWDGPDTSYTCEFMIYTLSSGKWRSLSTNLPTIPMRSFNGSVTTDQFIYWDVVLETQRMIVSFDVTSESFEAIEFPNSLARRGFGILNITNLRESLAILHYNINSPCTVWMMEHGDERTFTKLFTIKLNNSIWGFRKNGIPIMRVTDRDPDDDDHDHDDDAKLVKLVVYEPTLNHNSFLESSTYLYVDSYMETLLLLGRSDCISY